MAELSPVAELRRDQNFLKEAKDRKGIRSAGGETSALAIYGTSWKSLLSVGGAGALGSRGADS